MHAHANTREHSFVPSMIWNWLVDCPDYPDLHCTFTFPDLHNVHPGPGFCSYLLGRSCIFDQCSQKFQLVNFFLALFLPGSTLIPTSDISKLASILIIYGSCHFRWLKVNEIHIPWSNLDMFVLNQLSDSTSCKQYTHRHAMLAASTSRLPTLIT